MDLKWASGADLERAIARLVNEWGDPIVVHDETYAIAECEILVAGDMDGLAAISRRDRPIAELVAINAFARHRGTGTALIATLAETLRREGFHSLRLTTTNDNTDALRFYQRRGFRMAALRPGAVDLARLSKPTIPEHGDYDIPIRDELDLIRNL